MLQEHKRRGVMAVMAAIGMAVAAVTAAGSAGADGHLEEVAGGLDNPRGIEVGPAGRLVVAEAGRGGDVLVDNDIGVATAPLCAGMTGSITEIRNGSTRTLIELPSYAEAEGDTCPGVGAMGPHDVALGGRGELSIVIGLAGSLDARNDATDDFGAASLFGTAHRVLPNGKNKLLSDLVVFEANQEAGQGIDGAVDSNPFGIAIIPGARLIADAGGNSLVEVAANGTTSLVASFAPQCVPWMLPFPNPVPDAQNPCGSAALFPAQSVPTAVAVGPDGDYYVSELGGFPFVPGTARVWKVDADRSEPAVCSTFLPVPNDGCEVYADGLTSIVDIAFDDGGTLYAVQFADAGVLATETGGPLDGSVQIVPPGGGTPTGAIGGLTVPGGVAVDGDWLYITDFSIFPDAGRVVRTAVPH